MNYEDQVRAQMEQQAAQEQVQPPCPVEGDVDAAFGIIGVANKGASGTPRQSAGSKKAHEAWKKHARNVAKKINKRK